LDPIGLLARFNHFGALTVGTLDRDRDHWLPPRIFIMRSQCTEKLLTWNITGSTALPEDEREEGWRNGGEKIPAQAVYHR